MSGGARDVSTNGANRKSESSTAQAAGGLAQAASGLNQKSNNKKRTHEEAFPMPQEPTIEEVLTNIKQRVLNGETLNSFKKEIQSLVE